MMNCYFSPVNIILITKSAQPNQSLKLTEPAVDDLIRAKQTVTYWT